MKRVVCLTIVLGAAMAGCAPANPEVVQNLYAARGAKGAMPVQAITASATVEGKRDVVFSKARFYDSSGTVWELGVYGRDARRWELYRIDPDGKVKQVPLEMLRERPGLIPVWEPAAPASAPAASRPTR